MQTQGDKQAQSVTPLHRAPWCYSALPMTIKRHPLIGTTTKVCSHLISQTSIPSRNFPLLPILGNPQFEPGLHNIIFRGLSDAGLFQASHFSALERWKTIAELTDTAGPFRLDFFRALQLCHFLSHLPPPSDPSQPLITLEGYCTETGVLPHILSHLHSVNHTSSRLQTPELDYMGM